MTHTNSIDHPSYVILGASGGIGSTTARILVENNARVMLAGRESDRLTTLAQELSAPSIVIDATSTSDVEKSFSASCR